MLRKRTSTEHAFLVLVRARACDTPAVCAVCKPILFEKCAVAGSRNDFLCTYEPLEAGLYRIDIAYDKTLVDMTPFFVLVSPRIAPESLIAHFVAFGPALGGARPALACPGGVCDPHDRVGGTCGNPCWFTVESNGQQANVQVEVYAPKEDKFQLYKYPLSDQSVDFCFVTSIPGALSCAVVCPSHVPPHSLHCSTL